MTMSDRIAIIDGGRLQQCSPPLVCYDRPANTFVAEFIGSPSMNLFDGTAEADALAAADFRVEYDAALDLAAGDAVTLGVRPEDIALGANADGLASPSRPITATVDVLEPVGDKTYAYLLVERDDGDGDPLELLMSIEPDEDVEADDSIEIVFARENVHVFDGETGDAIAHSLASAGPDATGERRPIEGES